MDYQLFLIVLNENVFISLTGLSFGRHTTIITIMLCLKYKSNAHIKCVSYWYVSVQKHLIGYVRFTLSINLYSWCSIYGSHLTISLIFILFVWIKYLTFYISKVLFLRYLKVLLFYKFDFLEQYLRERFTKASGFHFETKSPISGSRAFICLHY